MGLSCLNPKYSDDISITKKFENKEIRPNTSFPLKLTHSKLYLIDSLMHNEYIVELYAIRCYFINLCQLLKSIIFDLTNKSDRQIIKPHWPIGF